MRSTPICWLSRLTSKDSLVSSQVYEIVRTIYTTTSEASEEGRVKVLQNTLGQLRLNNIATLDAIITHFTRLIDLTSADDAYITALTQNLASCILRPRVESNLTMDERHNYRLLRDLFDHKEEIFGELKRQASSLGTISASGPRPRAISSDESNRRANMEARARAIADRSRANSPAPGYRHRRDRSVGGSESTRFPINVSSPTTERRGARQSLEVPGSVDSPSTTELHHRLTETLNNSNNVTTNGSGATSSSAAAQEDSRPSTPSAVVVGKSNSLSRSSGRYSRIAGLNRDSSGNVVPDSASEALKEAAEQTPLRPVGVTLEDKPMDD